MNKNSTIVSKNISHSSQSFSHDNLYSLLNKYNINKNQFIIPVKDDYYDRNNLINKENIYDLICPICLNILNNPKSCCSQNTSHSFCKKCIDTYLKENNTCPICKNQFNYKTNYKVESKLINTKFKCKYNSDGCKTILNYYQYFKHINECKFKNKIFNMNVKLKNIIINLKNLKNVFFARKFKMLKIILKNALFPYIDAYFAKKILCQFI